MTSNTISATTLTNRQYRQVELRFDGRRARLVRTGGGVLTAERAVLASPSTHEPDSLLRLAAVGRSGVISRRFAVPEMDDQRLRAVIAHRLEADLPVGLDGVQWGYRRTTRKGGDGGVEVLVEAARNQVVSSAVSQLAGAGFAPDLLTTTAEAFGGLRRHAISEPIGDGHEILLVADGSEWTFAVLAGGHVTSVRRMAVSDLSGDCLARSLQQAVEAETPIAGITRILWCGQAGTSALADDLGRRLGVAFQPALPAANLVDESDQPVAAEVFAEWALPIGLAFAGRFEYETMIRLAVRPRRSARAQPVGFRRFLSLRIGGAVAAALIAVAALIHVGALAAENSRMDRFIQNAENDPNILSEFDPSVQAMRRLEKYRIDPEGILADLCPHVPPGMILSSIQLSRDRRLVIRGVCPDAKAVFAFAQAMLDGDRFDQVHPERSEPGQGGAFTITAHVTSVREFPSNWPGATR